MCKFGQDHFVLSEQNVFLWGKLAIGGAVIVRASEAGRHCGQNPLPPGFLGVKWRAALTGQAHLAAVALSRTHGLWGGRATVRAQACTC